ncbi:MAG: hypothetical protein AAGA30_04150 [Planctomycetota bacterium]
MKQTFEFKNNLSCLFQIVSDIQNRTLGDWIDDAADDCLGLNSDGFDIYGDALRSFMKEVGSREFKEQISKILFIQDKLRFEVTGCYRAQLELGEIKHDPEVEFCLGELGPKCENLNKAITDLLGKYQFDPPQAERKTGNNPVNEYSDREELHTDHEHRLAT